MEFGVTSEHLKSRISVYFVFVPLTLREEHRLRMSASRILRIFGPKREKVVRGWKRLHNEELH
jgi:hypothetical protein